MAVERGRQANERMSDRCLPRHSRWRSRVHSRKRWVILMATQSSMQGASEPQSSTDEDRASRCSLYLAVSHQYNSSQAMAAAIVCHHQSTTAVHESLLWKRAKKVAEAQLAARFEQWGSRRWR